MGTPSSGLKPIVVSTERPSSTAVTEQPPPRWQTTSRRAAHLLRRPRDRKPVEAVAADAPLLPPARRHGVRRGLRRDRRVEGRVEDGDVRHVRQRAPRLRDRVERRRVVQRRERRRAPRARHRPRVDDDRLAEPGRRRARRGARRRRPSTKPSTARRPLLVVDERELQARRARVDDEDPRSERPGPVAHVRHGRRRAPASTSRARSRRSTISCRSCAGPLGQAGHAVDARP